ncbi:TPA: ABC-three component system middle component 6 [Legionella pneumophila]
MILPSKHLSIDRALLTIGARLLQFLTRPQTVSSLWEEMHSNNENNSIVRNYEEFILGLDLLFMIGAIHLEEGLLNRGKA